MTFNKGEVIFMYPVINMEKTGLKLKIMNQRQDMM